MNDTIGERANRLKVFEIQQQLRRFKGQLVAAHRVYKREGELSKVRCRGWATTNTQAAPPHLPTLRRGTTARARVGVAACVL